MHTSHNHLLINTPHTIIQLKTLNNSQKKSECPSMTYTAFLLNVILLDTYFVLHILGLFLCKDNLFVRRVSGPSSPA